jgi:hypothetical protein
MALPIITLLASVPARAASLDDVVKEFEKSEGYVQPLATLFGSMTNSGWYQSASVPRGFGFYVGLPINFTQIGDDDREYKGSFPDQGCILYHQDQPGGTTPCPESVGYTGPTLFGKGKGPTVKTKNYNPNSNTFSSTDINNLTSDGDPTMSSFNWLPFAQPQLSFSYFHTEAKFRYIALPLDIFSVSLPAFGLQHDFAWAMPNSPVHASLAANWSFLSAEWTPGENIDGTLTLDGSSAFYGAVVGWTWKNWLEVFTEIGYETATVKTGGNLIINDEDGQNAPQVVKPNLTLEGRNGFRMALNVAFHLGYDAVIGQNIGAELGNQLSILAYRFK